MGQGNFNWGKAIGNGDKPSNKVSLNGVRVRRKEGMTSGKGTGAAVMRAR